MAAAHDVDFYNANSASGSSASSVLTYQNLLLARIQALEDMNKQLYLGSNGQTKLTYGPLLELYNTPNITMITYNTDGT